MALQDLMITQDGDLVLGNGDLTMLSGIQAYVQMASCRLQSITVDWFYDHIGADLESILGQPNTLEVAQKGESLIISALTQDGFLSQEQIYIDMTPTSAYGISYEVLITVDGETIAVNMHLDLIKGVSMA